MRVFYSTSPRNVAGIYNITNASRAKYFVDGFETVVQVDNIVGIFGDIKDKVILSTKEDR